MVAGSKTVKIALDKSGSYKGKGKESLGLGIKS